GDTSALDSLLNTHIVKMLTDASIDPDEEFALMEEEYMRMGGADYIAWYNDMMIQDE
ncbi:MAG TPA: hypothetical protein IAA84_12710, partial [Candidatus Alectryocaccomicrobium excrementavium]|nr:hypothetical protein [Candidatus Alectryocaccomicrobium excrementavium]